MATKLADWPGPWVCPNSENFLGERKIGPYSTSQKILLVGEGDFSFSSALADAFGYATNIVATSLDSFEEVMGKYNLRAKSSLFNLFCCGALILHNVDATEMANHPILSSFCFDAIVWNLPHAGFFGRREDEEIAIKKHRELLKAFFLNAVKLLKCGGEVHVTVKLTGLDEKWCLEELAQYAGLKLRESVRFHTGQYPGYRNIRGDGKYASETFYLGRCETKKFVYNEDAAANQKHDDFDSEVLESREKSDFPRLLSDLRSTMTYLNNLVSQLTPTLYKNEASDSPMGRRINEKLNLVRKRKKRGVDIVMGNLEKTAKKK